MSGVALTKVMSKGKRLFDKSSMIAAFLILLFFRLNWGYQYFVSGRGKFLNHSDIVDFFTSLHIPFPDFNAWFVAGVEAVGGILLILGLFNRPLGIILSINMIVAYLSVEDDRAKVLNFFKEQDPFFQADPFFFLLTALLAFAFGAGPLSLDRLIVYLWNRRTSKTNTQSSTQS